MSLKNSPTSKSWRIRVGITMGDPSGIGPEITRKAVHKLSDLADFVIIGDEWAFNQVQAESFRVQNCNFIDLKNIPHKNFSFGKIKAEYAKASIEYLDEGLELIKKEKIDCLVTCPVSKESINKAGFNFPGHTEYLAQKTDTQDFVMMLLNRYLKFSLVTRHTALKDIGRQLNKDRIYKTVFLTDKSLKELFLIKNPRIVVCGLNPHASDNGLIGGEENRLIKPALRSLRRKIKYIDGPLSADVAISKARQGEYDCVIAMYHDQALIPLKLLDKNSGANLTLGLPFVRTSPLHGTAFDIAGAGLAHPASLIEAIRLALRCTPNLKKA